MGGEGKSEGERGCVGVRGEVMAVVEWGGRQSEREEERERENEREVAKSK